MITFWLLGGQNENWIWELKRENQMDFKLKVFVPTITYHLFFRKYAIFCFKILYKRAAKIIEPTWLDFLSKNVSNYETDAVLPKMVKGISYIGTHVRWKIWKLGVGE